MYIQCICQNTFHRVLKNQKIGKPNNLKAYGSSLKPSHPQPPATGTTTDSHPKPPATGTNIQIK